MARLAALVMLATLVAADAWAEAPARVVDVAMRPGVTERMLVIAPQNPRATVVLFAGGHGGLQLAADGAFGWGKGNFLIRSRDLFAAQGLLVAIVNAPSDRQQTSFLSGFRQTGARDKELIAVDGCANRGDPCEAFAYHGYNGLEREVVARIAGWITAR